MTALIIIAAVLCVLLILLYGRVYVTVGYNTERDTEPRITVSYLFLRFGILPKKKKKIKLRDYSYKNFKRSEEKQLAEKKKAASKKKDASKKSKKTAAKTASADKKDGTKAQEPKKKNVVAVLWDIKDLIFDTLKRFPSKLRLDISRLKLSVGGKDAATAAITYGVVTEAVGAVLAVLDCFIKVKRGYKKEVEILPDFTSGKINADVLIRVSITPAAVLSLVFGFIGGFAIKFVKKNIKI